ncbi:SDR family oxidoreductase [Tistrella mobilis]|nr:SDR family oxidoreductase [Tistrella mobilis]
MPVTGLPEPPPAGRTMLPGCYDGRCVFITGGGTGLGLAMALEFARAGASIAIASRKAEHRAAGLAALEAAGCRAATAVALDVRDADAVRRAFDAVEAALGPVDVLVNNAAGNFPVRAEAVSPRGWQAVIDIVLTGSFLCAREFARRRIAAGAEGAVLNILATYIDRGAPGHAHSAAAKAGVANLTRTLAVEWAPDGIRVNAIAPGLFPHADHAPAMRERRPEGYDAEWNRIPALRVGRVRELGWAATYLCSPYAAYVTGHVFTIDGGDRLNRSIRRPVFVPVREQLPDPDQPARPQDAAIPGDVIRS